MIELYEGDCLEVMDKLIEQGVKVDAVITDPPYTDGKTNALHGHKIHSCIDIEKFSKIIYEILNENAFYAFFGQMPTIVAWHLSALDAGFMYVDHITWAKRMITSPYLPIQRSHEEIYIYKKGKPKYYKTNGKYEDLKTPAMHMGLYELSTVKTTISDLQRRLVERKYDELYWSKVPTANGNANDEYVSNMYKQPVKMRKKDDLDFWIEENSLQDVERNETFELNNIKVKKNNRNDDFFDRYDHPDSFRYRSKWYCNLTNVWSFLPENQTKFGKKGINIKHPTVKPILLFDRLFELLTDKEMLVLDPFLGSGTSGISSVNTNRSFIGIEKDPSYFNIAKQRINDAQNKISLFKDVENERD